MKTIFSFLFLFAALSFSSNAQTVTIDHLVKILELPVHEAEDVINQLGFRFQDTENRDQITNYTYSKGNRYGGADYSSISKMVSENLSIFAHYSTLTTDEYQKIKRGIVDGGFKFKETYTDDGVVYHDYTKGDYHVSISTGYNKKASIPTYYISLRHTPNFKRHMQNKVELN